MKNNWNTTEGRIFVTQTTTSTASIDIQDLLEYMKTSDRNFDDIEEAAYAYNEDNGLSFNDTNDWSVDLDDVDEELDEEFNTIIDSKKYNIK